jgi:hypothetical protein
MRTARLAVVAAGLATVGLALSASAATPPPKPKSLSFGDATGDALGVGGDDIVKVTYTSAGTTKKVGKKYVYTPNRLVMTLQLADAIADGDVQYNVEGAVPGCSFYLYTAPGSALDDGSAFGGCNEDGTDTSTDLQPTVTSAGKTITFTIPLGVTSGFKAGAAVTSLYAYTGVVDPITGEVGPTIVGSGPADADQATSTATYKIG